MNAPAPERRATFTAGAGDAGRRLDVWLAGLAPFGLSRARVQALIREGCVQAGGRRISAHTRVTPGLCVTIRLPPPEPADARPEPIPLDVLYEDADLVVVNKPPGLVVHPAAGHRSGTLVNALLFHCRDLAGVGGEQRPGIVHRLDKDTSGVMAAVKNGGALLNLAGQFKAGRVDKVYLAMVHGVPCPDRGRIETLIGRSRRDRKRMSARPVSGKTALTAYEVAEAFADAALLKVTLHTGRTHQIRVHMAHRGHAVIGDATYGSRARDRRLGLAATRQLLHARRLAFAHPRDGRPMRFEAPVPADMQAALEVLRGAGGGAGAGRRETCVRIGARRGA